jgi:hypothetical protein
VKSAIPPLSLSFRQRIVFGNLPGRLFSRYLHCDRLALPFATLRKPSTQSFGKAFRGQPKTRFDFALSDWESVVEVGGVGEVSHAELIEPFEWACAALATNDYVHIEFLRVHAFNAGEAQG